MARSALAGPLLPVTTTTTGRRKAYPRIRDRPGVEGGATTAIVSVVAASTMIGEVIWIVEEAVAEVGTSVVVDVEEEDAVDIEVLTILTARRMGEGRVTGIMITLLPVEV